MSRRWPFKMLIQELLQCCTGAKLCCQDGGVCESEFIHASLFSCCWRSCRQRSDICTFPRNVQIPQTPLAENDTRGCFLSLGGSFLFIVILHVCSHCKVFFVFVFCNHSQAFLGGVPVSPYCIVYDCGWMFLLVHPCVSVVALVSLEFFELLMVTLPFFCDDWLVKLCVNNMLGSTVGEEGESRLQ